MAEAQLLNALLRIPLDLVDPGPNVRTNLTGIEELATSIKRLGMQKPLLVTQIGDRYRILDGHRRYAAARRLGLEHVDGVLRREAPDVVRIQQQLAIQAQTEGFDPIAESIALNGLMWEHKLSREEIAAAIGRSPAWVRDRISLVHLTPDEKRQVAAGVMPVVTALATLRQRRAERDGAALVRTRAVPARGRAGSEGTREVSKASVATLTGAHCRTCSCEVRRA